MKFCHDCARTALTKWKGWPHRAPIPLLQKMARGVCVECGSRDVLESNRIRWRNVHGEFNTGLPDYWLLEIDGDGGKWGYPYYSESCCGSCGQVSITSQMCYPNGRSEFKSNCESCGVRNGI